MQQTVYGILADRIGLASSGRSAWASPSSEFRSVQNATIPVDRDHDRIPVGEIVYLERAHGNLFAVAHVHDHVTPTTLVKVGDKVVSVETDLYWSASRWANEDYEDIILHSVSLTAFPARNHPTPVTFLPGVLDHRDAPRRWSDQLDTFERELLHRAAHTHLDRRAAGRGEPIIVSGGHDGAAAHHLELRRHGTRAHTDDAQWRTPSDDLEHSAPHRGSIISVR